MAERSQRKYFGVMHVIDPSLGVQIYHFCKPVTRLPSRGPFASQQARLPLAGSAKGWSGHPVTELSRLQIWHPKLDNVFSLRLQIPGSCELASELEVRKSMKWNQI